uniref:Bicarbonate transporter-like transmembrane domain-containing protein n=1 Tax=Grammatophora oceanica TaxID=210454 RepID=A0A7S1UPF3_9STRA
MAFTISLAQLAKQLSLPFLPLYAWTGIWTSGMLLTAALTSTCNIVQYLTRFTDEIFSVLISSIFLFEAITDVAKTFTSPASVATKALLTLVCSMVTFGSALTLKGLKTSTYFTKSLRNNLSNFAPAIGVTLGSLVARAARLKYGVAAAALPVLKLPTQFATTTGRPWWIPLLDLPTWARWGAAVPALLATVLLFLDQNITARLVNNPRYKMTKGRDTQNVLDGMHGDMLVLSALTGLTSVFGLPWMAGATTRSAAHVRSLTIVDSKTGEITGTLENRVSGAAIHALIGACVFFAKPRQLLAEVPLPVLSGVFMYLGFTSLQGLELWERIKGLFQDKSVAPKMRWSVAVPRLTTVVYTGIQMACVAAMMRVTKSKIGVISPLMIAVLPLLRLGLMKSGLVKKESMNVLDG